MEDILEQILENLENKSRRNNIKGSIDAGKH